MSWETKNYSILLVEDNKLNQTVVKFTLRRYGYLIDVANNGIEAIEMFKQGDYDFILMDIMMPEMDGLDATRAIRNLENGQKIPIIALTADIMIANEEKCLRNGMNGHIAKPFEIDNLFKVLKSLDL
ncbi:MULTISPECIES: response regulator [Labilibaculum]|uniref:Response regulator n=1 Tax=Labilibaculum euxinus TaxID=2686357 RepID=A0A7M4D2I8_9BACT|nr:MULTISPECIES: response regulator [Labilibaculum]MDM8160337.1 response regulator [Labilibaculum sp. K2S]MUP36867.1 response regulator [Labilibaculum euxinus]MVB06072.1 response regulator [Labilibaculum euxinus]